MRKFVNDIDANNSKWTFTKKYSIFGGVQSQSMDEAAEEVSLTYDYNLIGAGGETLVRYHGKLDKSTYDDYAYVYPYEMIVNGGEVTKRFDETRSIAISGLRGNVRVSAEIDASGNAEYSCFEYNPFGKQIGTYALSAQDIGFGGAKKQMKSDYYQLGVRSYDPNMGRFLQQDPLFEMFTGHSSYSFGFNNPVMFGDPSGMAPEKHKGGGDVLLGSGSLFKYLGLYSATTTASYAVVTHRERVLVGVQRYEIAGRSVDNPDGPVYIDCTPIDIGKTHYGYAGVYEMQNVSRLVKISGGVPSGGPGPGGGGDSRSAGDVNDNGKVSYSINNLVTFSFEANANSDYVDKFTNEMQQMYDVFPDMFEGLSDLDHNIDVEIVPGSQIKNMLQKANALPKEWQHMMGVPALVRLPKDGSYTTLYLAEELISNDYSKYDRTTKDAFTNYQTWDFNYAQSELWMVLGHELGHILDALAVGYATYATFGSDYKEFHANRWADRLRDAFGDANGNKYPSNTTWNLFKSTFGWGLNFDYVYYWIGGLFK